MAAREFHGIIYNTWDKPLYRVADECDSGQWQDPWYPSKIPGAGKIDPLQHGEWRSESDGFLTGTSGWARWAVSVLEIGEGFEHFEYVQVNWSIPFIQVGGPLFPKVNITCSVSRNDPDPQDPFARPDPRPPILALVPWIQTAEGLALPSGEDDRALGLIEQAGTLVATFFLPNQPTAEHAIVPFTLRRRPISQTAQPIVPAKPKGIIYAVTPVVPATLPTGTGTGIGSGTGGHPASGGDLTWAHHIGREDGRFAWEGPKKVGSGWSGFEHVFSGGDGIIYGIDPVVKARVLFTGETTPASGGNLWWYRHVGSADGSFKWEGPKKVGSGWSGFEHVFSGGDGVIYLITHSVPAGFHTGTGTGIGSGTGGQPASGGDLMWARHLGRGDGSFRWQGPTKKVGSGWGQLQQVFSGGDGIIYAITPIVEATLPIGIGPGMGGHPASGGDLMWYRHIGRDDGSFKWEGPKKVGSGWGRLNHVFSGGDGIIYGIDPIVEARVRVTGGTTPASGGDLWWGRHIGRANGSFNWDGPLKRVGTGWGELLQVFSGD
jgi:hypothetical protein